MPHFCSCHNFSFSGCIIEEGEEKTQNIDSLKIRIVQWKKSFKNQLKQMLLLLASMFFIYGYFEPVINGAGVDEAEKNNTEALMNILDEKGKNNQIRSEALRIQDFGKIVVRIAWAADQSEELKNLKPILRMLMKWLMYIFLADEFVAISYNFVFGGAFLFKLITMDELAECDRSPRFGRLLILSNYLFVLSMKAASIWLYESEAALMLFYPEEDKTVLIALLKFGFETIFHVVHFICLSMHTLWFVYIMVMYRRKIEYLHQEMFQCMY